MMRPTVVQIDSAAIVHNLRLLKSWGGEAAFFCPMVKANAYGHGDTLVARIIENSKLVSALGVALFEEGVSLRLAGIQSPILVFAPIESASMADAIEHRLTPVAGRFEDLHVLAASGDKIRFHLKFNTGMNRLGFDMQEIEPLRQFLKLHPQLEIEGVCTHLSHGEEAHEPAGPTQKQISCLLEMTKGLPGVRHAHKSASLCALHAHGVKVDAAMGSRPGISVYGLPQDGHRTAVGLKPALKWSTKLIRFHKVGKGEAVSYGARWIAQQPSMIGIVPVGYGDGYMRVLSNKAEMLFRNERVPVVGSVCMDYTLVDLTRVLRGDVPKAGGDIVILGRQGANEVTAAELAEKAGTIAYEIATSISRRVPREVI